MTNKDDLASLEKLLESLIKMVGRANKNSDSLQKSILQVNQKIDSLQMRISQLEWVMKTHLEEFPHEMYSIHPQTNNTPGVHGKIPFHF